MAVCFGPFPLADLKGTIPRPGSPSVAAAQTEARRSGSRRKSRESQIAGGTAIFSFISMQILRTSAVISVQFSI